MMLEPIGFEELIALEIFDNIAENYHKDIFISSRHLISQIFLNYV